MDYWFTQQIAINYETAPDMWLATATQRQNVSADAWQSLTYIIDITRKWHKARAALGGGLRNVEGRGTAGDGVWHKLHVESPVESPESSCHSMSLQCRVAVSCKSFQHTASLCR